MLAHDLANRRKPEPIACDACREEWLEKALESELVNTTPGIADRNTHIASRFKLSLREVSQGGYLMQVGFDLNPADLIHCLCGVVAKIENHLLQLCGLTGNDG